MVKKEQKTMTTIDHAAPNNPQTHQKDSTVRWVVVNEGTD
jgi:hypothetical protein